MCCLSSRAMLSCPGQVPTRSSAAERHPQVSGLGTPSVRPPAPSRWGGRWGSASAQPDTGEMGTACAAAGSVHREGGIWGLRVPPGRDENRERPWALQPCGWVSCAEQVMHSPLEEGESCYSTGRQNISGEPVPNAALQSSALLQLHDAWGVFIRHHASRGQIAGVWGW